MRHPIIVRSALALSTLVLVGLLWPETTLIPVEGASARDWNARSFWYEPWGVSGIHKGIDIFAPRNTTVRTATSGLVVYRGSYGKGGNVVIVLGPRWRLHYYAHLSAYGREQPWLVRRGTPVGTVGTSGNAAGKAPHLHYSVFSLLPLPWRYSSAHEGWQQMFYLDPGALLLAGQ